MELLIFLLLFTIVGLQTEHGKVIWSDKDTPNEIESDDIKHKDQLETDPQIDGHMDIDMNWTQDFDNGLQTEHGKVIWSDKDTPNEIESDDIKHKDQLETDPQIDGHMDIYMNWTQDFDNDKEITFTPANTLPPANRWRCKECEQEYTPSEDGLKCISCRDNIENCMGCYSYGEDIRCSLCDEGFYINNGTTCEVCGGNFDNCRTCRYQNQNDSESLFCTECDAGFFFDYHGNCSACNETIPQCSTCSSFAACQVFGPAQNLTCHECEANYYLGEDKASCKLNCRNISRFCEHCSLDDGDCYSCSLGYYFNATTGECEDCKVSIPKCSHCNNETGQILCSLCDEGFALDQAKNSCKKCSAIPHCEKCHFPGGGSALNCQQCAVGFTISHARNSCHDCRNVTDHCGLCTEDDTCSACVPGFTLTDGKCEVTVCGVPPPPPYRGGYGFTGMSYGDTVTYDCECGYDLQGEQVLTCDESGEWGTPPCCIKKLFGIPGIKDLHSNQLNDCNVMDYLNNMPNTYINVLILTYNNLTSIPFLTNFKQLDTVMRLYLRNNKIKSFIWDYVPDQTKELDLGGNKIRRLPRVGKYDSCKRLKRLNLYNNEIETIGNDQMPTTLRYLHLIGNKLTEISDLSDSRLLSLSLNINPLKELIPNNLPQSLEALHISAFNTAELPNFSHLHNVRILSLSGLMSINPDHLPPNVEYLTVYFNGIGKHLNISQFNKANESTFSFINLNFVIPDNLPEYLTNLHLTNSKINEFPNLSQFRKLKTLSLRGNNLSSIQPDYLPENLKRLELGFNIINEFSNLSQFRKLETLNMMANNLMSIQPDYLPENLNVLEVQYNKINEFSNLSHCRKLEYLDLTKNNLMSIQPDYLPVNLKRLNLGCNKFNKFPNLSQLKNLRSLDFSENNLTAVTPDYLPSNLKELILTESMFHDVDKTNFPKSLIIRLEDNSVLCSVFD